jgi:hypothetical protein
MGANGAQSPLIGGRAGRFSPSNQKTTDTNGTAIPMPEGITAYLERLLENRANGRATYDKGGTCAPP